MEGQGIPVNFPAPAGAQTLPGDEFAGRPETATTTLILKLGQASAAAAIRNAEWASPTNTVDS
jgi:hypothetical protein